MLLDIMEDFFADTLTRHRATLAAAADDPVVALRGLIRSTLSVIARDPDTALVVVGECRRLAQTERFGWLAERTAETSGMWRRVLEDGVRSGAFRADLRPATTAHLVQTAVWAMAQWYRGDGRYGPDEASGIVVDLFLGGLAASEAYRTRGLDAILGGARPSRPAVGVAPKAFGTPEERMGRMAVPGTGDARARIAYAAGVLFAQQGYAVTTIRQIAELAGVPVGSVAHHIGSKERLFAQMMNGFFRELREGFERDAALGPTPIARIEGLVRHTVDTLADHGVVAVILINERWEDLPTGELDMLFGYVDAVWTQAFADGMSAGVLRDGLDAAFAQRVVRSAISTSSGAFRGMGVADVAGLYQEIALAGIGARA
ncbi:TetR family transcriptional regulator [Yinghuangia seranimata]|uniref:TetR family transcriptional regulator n=1 Tax=Yinghuangia seranimata TaxID=408067 RepID=UPI00248BACBD|nr:TetR family transcriptional regulator [Yinghuangia seranimata]MDI2128846.1 TetR family transcriptional regulator [Yinghuangia seranimata]